MVDRRDPFGDGDASFVENELREFLKRGSAGPVCVNTVVRSYAARAHSSVVPVSAE